MRTLANDGRNPEEKKEYFMSKHSNGPLGLCKDGMAELAAADLFWCWQEK
jgi:hypothetical protein